MHPSWNLPDAAAVYAHLVTHHLGARKGPDGKCCYPDLPIPNYVHPHDVPATQDPVLDKSTLSMCQTLDYETQLRTCSTSSGTEVSPSGDAGHRQHVKSTQREGGLRDSVEPLINGNEATPHSPVSPVYLTQAKSDGVVTARRPRSIPIGDGAGGHFVLALARWIRDERVLPVPDGMLLLSPSCDPCTHRSMASGSGSLT